MGAVDGNVMLEQGSDEIAFAAYPRVLWAPEEAVMNQHEVSTGKCCLADGGETGIDAGGNAADFPAVFNLQTVVGAIVVGDGINAEFAVAVFDNSCQVGLWHTAM